MKTWLGNDLSRLSPSVSVPESLPRRSSELRITPSADARSVSLQIVQHCGPLCLRVSRGIAPSAPTLVGLRRSLPSTSDRTGYNCIHGNRNASLSGRTVERSSRMVSTSRYRYLRDTSHWNRELSGWPVLALQPLYLWTWMPQATTSIVRTTSSSTRFQPFRKSNRCRSQ